VKIPVGWNPDPSTPPQHRWWDGGSTPADPNAHELPSRKPPVRWLVAGVVVSLAIVIFVIAVVASHS
jgi:hypothetical protein